jgi:hypothetical protein
MPCLFLPTHAVVRGSQQRVETSQRRIAMTFYEFHVLVINTLARLFGGLALAAGSFFLLSAYAIAADRWTDVLVGFLLIAMGVAVFVAKPVAVETIANIRRRMGSPDK